MQARVTAIVPSGSLTGDPVPAAEAALLNFAGAAIRLLATYPPAVPSSTYRRTGTLGRNWFGKAPVVERNGADMLITIENATEYSGWVEGPEDERASLMAERGWPSIDDVTTNIWPEYEARIQQVFENLQR